MLVGSISIYQFSKPIKSFIDTYDKNELKHPLLARSYLKVIFTEMTKAYSNSTHLFIKHANIHFRLFVRKDSEYR
jgi:hypothetical protein